MPPPPKPEALPPVISRPLIDTATLPLRFGSRRNTESATVVFLMMLVGVPVESVVPVMVMLSPALLPTGSAAPDTVYVPAGTMIVAVPLAFVSAERSEQSPAPPAHAPVPESSVFVLTVNGPLANAGSAGPASAGTIATAMPASAMPRRRGMRPKSGCLEDTWSMSVRPYERAGKTPCSAMMNVTVRYGGMLLCGCPPPATLTALGAIEVFDVLLYIFSPRAPLAWAGTAPLGEIW